MIKSNIIRQQAQLHQYFNRCFDHFPSSPHNGVAPCAKETVSLREKYLARQVKTRERKEALFQKLSNCKKEWGAVENAVRN